MIYKSSVMLRDVRVMMDKNSVSPLLGGVLDIDQLSVDEIILSNLVKAVRNVHTVAPVYLLEQGHRIGDSVYWNGDGSGWVLLPDDFMRLVVFEMSDWSRPVYDVLPPADAAFPLQHSRWKGVRGTSEKPVCVLSVRQEGKVLEFYSCKSEDAYIVNDVYLPYPRLDANDGIDISERCYDAAVYECASLTFGTLGDATSSALMRAESRTLLGLQATTTNE